MHLVAAVVVNQRAPIGVRALARVGVFVQVAAVEISEAMGVAREMRGRPIENHADASLVAAIDKLHEFCGCAIAASSGEIAKGLVAPGAVVRMLHDGQQLNVCVPEFFDVRNQLVGELAVV